MHIHRLAKLAVMFVGGGIVLGGISCNPLQSTLFPQLILQAVLILLGGGAAT